MLQTATNKGGTPHEVETDSFWTSGQRQGHSLHEISYRACFKPQLPEFFIDRYSRQGDVVLDPFLGRGTTAIQAMLMGRVAYGSDINPLSAMLTEPRLAPPHLPAVEKRFHEIPDSCEIGDADADMLVFYHPDTLRRLLSLREWFIRRGAEGTLDVQDRWLRMVLINRLTGHSPGFLSVKTMPPNQAVSIERQRKINKIHGRTPEPKDVLAVIMKKSKSLLRDWMKHPLLQVVGSDRKHHSVKCADACRLDYVEDGTVQLLVTSPPFLNVVDYASDNWLRCWFAGVDPAAIPFTGHSKVSSWERFVKDTFTEFTRVVKRGGCIAFEVGEVRNGSVRLEDNVINAVNGLPFIVEKVFINMQKFTKTANCWGVANNEGGTNTNRIVLLRRT